MSGSIGWSRGVQALDGVAPVRRAIAAERAIDRLHHRGKELFVFELLAAWHVRRSVPPQRVFHAAAGFSASGRRNSKQRVRTSLAQRRVFAAPVADEARAAASPPVRWGAALASRRSASRRTSAAGCVAIAELVLEADSMTRLVEQRAADAWRYPGTGTRRRHRSQFSNSCSLSRSPRFTR